MVKLTNNKRRGRNVPFFIITLISILWSLLVFIASKTSTISKPSSTHHLHKFLYNDIAQEVPGIKLTLNDPTNNKNIDVVYAEPKHYPKGLVLVLHACTHNAFKLFSPSSTCPECIGLSEEVRMIRLILHRGYTVVALSSSGKNGCWSNKDISRIETVLQHYRFNSFRRIIAVGASSGGSMSAELLALKKVQASIVMIMSLSSQLVSKLSLLDTPIVYFAPMPNDKGTTKRVIENCNALVEITKTQALKIDTKTCTSLPLTPQYLLQRVPNLSINDAIQIHQSLKQHDYIHSTSNFFKKNPTNTPWREMLSPNNATYLYDKYVLTPGYSPLAKAFHRAWAFHEYCSDVINPSFDFVEEQMKLYHL